VPDLPENEQISAIDEDLEDMFFGWTPDRPEDPGESERQLLAEHRAYFGPGKIKELPVFVSSMFKFDGDPGLKHDNEAADHEETADEHYHAARLAHARTVRRMHEDFAAGKPLEPPVRPPADEGQAAAAP
jgi:hypothetical protein